MRTFSSNILNQTESNQMKRFLLFFLILLSFLSQHIQAQDAPKLTEENTKIIKNEFYNNISLPVILLDLEKKYSLKLLYDKEALKEFNVTHWFENQTIESGLKTILKKLPLKYFIDDNGFVNIVSKTVRIEPSVDRQFNGKPEKTNFTLTGRVVDVINGENLPFASILVKGTSIGVQTNVDGYFTLQKVPSDTMTLEVSYIGYRTRSFHLNPKLNVSDLKIEVEPAVDMLDEVAVEAEKSEVLKANEVVGMIKMTPRNIAKLPNLGERDPFRAFQLMPGVSASNESSSGLYVRGGTPDQTLVLYDGFTVYHVDHLFGFFSAFN